MCKIVRNYAILLQNTTLNPTLIHALAMTLTLTPDPNSNLTLLPFRIYIPHSAFYRTPKPAADRLTAPPPVHIRSSVPRQARIRVINASAISAATMNG